MQFAFPLSAHAMTVVRHYGFGAAALLPLLPVAAYWLGAVTDQRDLCAFLPVLGLFTIDPLIDALVGRDRTNPPPEDVPRLERDGWYRAVLYAFLPLQIGAMVWGAWVFCAGGLSWVGQIGWVLSVGAIGGLGAINVAHELIHKDSALDRAAGGLLLSSVSYGSFKVEHVRGHHVHVATPQDGSTARVDQSVYDFVLRAPGRNFALAWRLERDRLRGKGRRMLGPHDELLWWYGATALLAGGLALALGAGALPYFFGQSAVAVAELEVINYLEHYGLRRRQRENGTYEPVTAAHSWDSAFLLSNLFLLHLPRHADHHLHAKRPYQLLRHRDDSPQLPWSYAAMFLLALVPPLWRRVMNPRIPGTAGNTLGGPAPRR